MRLVLIFLLLALIGAPVKISLSAAAPAPARELEEFQGYLDAAPGGMDIRHAWTLPGGHGENVRIADVEVNWNLEHNDLAPALRDPFLLVRGNDPFPQVNKNHGTAVLGVLVAAPDGIGVTGIAHAAEVGLITPLDDSNRQRLADAINRAARKLEPGDVLLIEQQSAQGPRFNPQSGRGLAPAEWEPDVFEAIKAATDKGIVVVEPAGNGFEDLDHAAYAGRFDRGRRDSGAIIVGSAQPPPGIYGPGPDRERTEESNYGSRVDLQGWGRYVTTCGYGDLRREQGENNWYTVEFGGTSGAAAMVAGAAAVLQSILIERGQPPLSPAQLRRLLVSTGSRQTGDTRQHIGPRPDLRAALAALDTNPAERTPQITRVNYKRSSGKLIVDGENFLDDISVIEINGTAIPRMKYPSSYVLPGGLTTRVMSKGDISALLPAGVSVSITVYNPATDKRSAPVSFTNQ